MRVLISGICGFAGSTIAEELSQQPGISLVTGFDNYSRSGSSTNVTRLRQAGIEVVHADCRCPSDIENLPAVDWVIDAAASPSVVAGIGGGLSSRQLIETNLYGTVNLLEYCKRHQAGFVLLSTSRVYSIAMLKQLPLLRSQTSFELDPSGEMPAGVSLNGIRESFSCTAPISLYGATKLSSEMLAQEYSQAFDFPLWINRCGVLAGAGQFGRADQGIFAYWLHSWRERARLRYLGFQGSGLQTRDCLHPKDLARLILTQMQDPLRPVPVIANVSGGMRSATSLLQLSQWCAERWGEHPVTSEPAERAFDVPWLVLDSTLASKSWEWQPNIDRESILQEIASHAEANPDWLDVSR